MEVKHSEIARVLAARGWRQEDLAEALGVSKVAVSAWFCRRRTPSYVLMLRMRDEFGIPLESWQHSVGREVAS